MKKTFLLLTLMVCAAAAFSQEAVGKLIAKEPYLEIEVDFYENNVSIETVLKIIVFEDKIKTVACIKWI